MAEMVWNAMQNYNKATTPEEQYTAVHDLILNYYGAQITQRWSKDISLVIDELNKWESSTFLTHHIDTARIGVLDIRREELQQLRPYLMITELKQA